MSSLRFGLSSCAISLFVLGLGAASCGGSDASPPGTTTTGTGGTGDVPATGGTTSTGGTSVTGGTSGTSGTGGTQSTGGSGGTVPTGDSTITPCPGASTLDPTMLGFTTCDMCDNAWCVPNSLVPAGAGDVLASCDAENKCVPDAYVRVAGNFLPKTCTSLEYAPGMFAEGRCISTCVPQVQQQADQLPQADCASGEKCAPCWNPIDGTDTHACTQGCDTGPSSTTPQQFAECGDSDGFKRGVCVPPELVPADLAQFVPPDTCTDGWLCAPKEKAADINYVFPTCMAAIAPFPAVPGACVPRYLTAGQFGAELLTKGTCTADGDVCAPCESPTMPGTPTGACQ